MKPYNKTSAENEKAVETHKIPAANTGEARTLGNIEMVYIKGGTFIMGSPEREDEYEHEVTVSSFWIGRYVVTYNQYTDATGEMYWVKTEDNLPVWMCWEDAVSFCNKISNKNGLQPYYKIKKNFISDDEVSIVGGNGFRLPTEAEWEYACRAGTRTAYYWGDKIDANYCWYKDSWMEISKVTQHGVGEKRPNPWGLYDMSGNAWEWCWDYYSKNYYEESPRDNPPGPDSGRCRVSRGGSWCYDSRFLRSAMRVGVRPDTGLIGQGIRLVISAE